MPHNASDISDQTIICYCSGITVAEIKRAVAIECANIEQVRDHLDKHITGYCHRTSPHKKCCGQTFNEIIAEIKKQTK